jgi:ribosomal protein L14E/L6E/L27E
MRQMVPRRSLNIRHSTATSTKIKNNSREKPVPRSQREKNRTTQKQVKQPQTRN